jgi:hypothetical protein
VWVVFHCEGGTDIASVSKQSAEKDVKTQERWRKGSFRLLGIDDGELCYLCRTPAIDKTVKSGRFMG